ncbi:hypothetical protein CANMA_000740 [Candida margitis]|uniref:uncharacterized protein n=1 Tax=Candida margitis TaxID=1775924 RepID=UPI002227514E|nr:uncharacterized protein CANMA_000740 [Candida margitis]KAI5970129.1 hypothetical protein CANMA_000740 [Candida margitis]
MSTSTDSIDPLEVQDKSNNSTSDLDVQPITDYHDRDVDDIPANSGGFTGAALAKEQTVRPDSVRRDSAKQRQSVGSIRLTYKERLREYIKVAPKFIWAYVQVFCIYVGFLSIYWGTLYKREERFQNVEMLVVNDDTSFMSNGTEIQPYISDAFIELLQEPQVRYLANFKVINTTDFRDLAESHNNTLYEEVVRQIHHQKYWAGFYIKPQATQLIYDSFASGNATYMTSGQINQTVTVVYETGRHFSALNQYLIRNLNTVAFDWNTHLSRNVYPEIIQSLSSTQQENLLQNTSIPIFTTFPILSFVDNRSSSNSAILGPSELGLIYALLFSFNQFNFSVEIYRIMRERLKYRSYLFYRLIVSQLNALLLALVYGLMTIALKIPTETAFGHAGFVVLWMFMYLFLSAVGVVNEIVMSIIMAFNQQLLIAPWMIFNIVSNISATFAPFVLMPGFYKYGYAMPMYNIYEALKVVFFNTWKGHLGRNLGVLIIWIVVGNVLLVLVSNWAVKRARRMQAAAKE